MAEAPARQAFNAERPFNELPDLPPPREQIETVSLLKRVITARSSLAELKGACQSLPNPDLLLNAVVLQESKDSSEIENIVTTQDELFRAAAAAHSGAAVPPATKEVLRYREAMYLGWNELQTTGLIVTNTLIRVMQRLRDTEAGIRKQPGTVIAKAGSGEVVYTPPEGEELIRRKLAALERFMYENDQYDPLIRMALAHYQFEAIHPFTDGNGRTGRIMNVLYLMQQQLLTHPVLYLSGYVLRRRQEYYQRLRDVTEKQAWGAWLEYMIEAVHLTAQATLRLVREINNLLEEYVATAKRGMSTGYSRDLIRLIFHQPYCKIQMVVDAGLAKRVTASKYLSELEQLGILHSIQVQRDKYFVNHRLLDMLSEANREM